MGGFFSRRQDAHEKLGPYNFNQQRGEQVLNARAAEPCNKGNNYCLGGGRKTLKKRRGRSAKSAKSAKKLKKTSKRRL